MVYKIFSINFVRVGLQPNMKMVCKKEILFAVIGFFF